MSKKSKTSSPSPREGNHNYYLPLQTVDVDEIDNDDNEEIIIDNSTKMKIPPITILKCKTEQMNELCRILKITDISMRKISIGLHFFLTKQEDVDPFLQ